MERLIGTLMRHVRLLPGSSYSDLLRATPRHAEARATLTLSELGGFLIEDIDRYHRRHIVLSVEAPWRHGNNHGLNAGPVLGFQMICIAFDWIFCLHIAGL